MWFIPGAYAALLLVRLFVNERKTTDWLVPIAHIAIWGYFLQSLKTPMNDFSQSLTMSWGLFALVIILVPLIFDQKKQYPELFDASLLVGLFLSILWVSSAGVKLATPMSSWSIGATWLFDFAGALLLSTGMLAWRLYLDGPGERGEIASWNRRLQATTVIVCTLGLLCAFQETGRLTILKQGYLVFLVLAMGGLLLPGMQPTLNSKSSASSRKLEFPRPSRLWAFSGAIFTISWALVRLFVTV